MDLHCSRMEICQEPSAQHRPYKQDVEAMSQTRHSSSWCWQGGKQAHHWQDTWCLRRGRQSMQARVPKPQVTLSCHPVGIITHTS